MIFITAKFRVRPEAADQWAQITRVFTDATRREPGCLWFDWSRSLDDQNEYVLVEAFRDGDAGSAHVNSDHFKTAMAWMPGVIAEKPEIINVEVPGDGFGRMAELTPTGP